MKHFLLIIVLVLISTKSFSNTLYLKCVEQSVSPQIIHFKVIKNKDVFYRMDLQWLKWCKNDFKILDDGYSCYSNDDGVINYLELDVFLKKLSTTHIRNNDDKSFKRHFECQKVK